MTNRILEELGKVYGFGVTYECLNEDEKRQYDYIWNQIIYEFKHSLIAEKYSVIGGSEVSLYDNVKLLLILDGFNINEDNQNIHIEINASKLMDYVRLYNECNKLKK